MDWRLGGLGSVGERNSGVCRVGKEAKGLVGGGAGMEERLEIRKSWLGETETGL